MQSKPKFLAVIAVFALFVLMLSILPDVSAADADASQRGFVWNSGTDLNGPNEHVMIEVPLLGMKVGTFKVTISYAYGGDGWTAFMNRGGPQYANFPDTGGAIQTVTFTVAPESVNRRGTQNVSIRGQGAIQGLHLYSIEVVPVSALSTNDVPLPVVK